MINSHNYASSINRMNIKEEIQDNFIDCGESNTIKYENEDLFETEIEIKRESSESEKSIENVNINPKVEIKEFDENVQIKHEHIDIGEYTVSESVEPQENCINHCDVKQQVFIFETIYDKKHKCTKCEYQTDIKKNMKRHLDMHADIRPYECEICKKRFRRSHHLKMHNFTHSENKKFHCTHCDYQSNDKLYFIQHLRDVHLGETEKKYKCAECPYKTNMSFHMTRHLRKHLVGNEKRFKCAECPYQTDHKSNLRIHIGSQHIAERERLHLQGPDKKFKCHYCSYQTHRSGDLKRHFHIHDKIKPFECDICQQRFSRKDHFQLHVKNKHNIG